MKKNLLRAGLMIAALATVYSAFAQDAGGPPPPGQDGGGQGGPGGPGGMRGQRGGMMRGGGPQILLMPKVQTELGLSDDQITKIKAILPQRGQGGPGMGGPGGGGPGGGGQGGPPGDGGQGGPPPAGDGGQGGPPPQDGGQGGPPGGGPGGGQGMRGGGQAQMAAMEAKIKPILSDSQFKRYTELSYQAGGVQSLLRPEVAEKLGITDDQRTQIQALVRPARGQGGPGGGGPGGGQGGPPGDGGQGGPPPGGDGGQGGPPPQGGGGPGMRGGMNAEARKAMEAKVLAILTADQQMKWTAMQGKKFDFSQPRPQQ